MPATRLPERDHVAAAVIESAREVLALRGGAVPDISMESRLIGRSAILDSLGLVTLIVDLEQRIETDFEVSLSLANERAMSQAKSPFKSIDSLTDYIHEQLIEIGQHG